MSTLNTLNLSWSYDALKEDLSTPITICEARTLTAGVAVPLIALMADVDVAAAKEWNLVLEVRRAEALCTALGFDINHTIDAVANACRTVNPDSTEKPLAHYFGPDRPMDVKALGFADKLARVRQWIPSLTGSPHPTLTALAPDLLDQVNNGDKALVAWTDAKTALKDFREVGPRKTLLDDINAARQQAHGQLGQIAHANPQAHLPSNFADSCFDHEDCRKPSLATLESSLVKAQKRVVQLQERIAEKKAAEKKADEKKAAKEAAKKQKELEAAQKKAAKANAKVQELAGPSPATPG